MRKQYHFRPGDSGLRAWDVDRLILLTRDFEPREVSLNQIVDLDEPFWFGVEGTPPTCRDIANHLRLVEEAELKFPIILSSNGRLMDGMHRVVKALLNGGDSIRAVQFSVDPEPDFVGVDPEHLPY